MFLFVFFLLHLTFSIFVEHLDLVDVVLVGHEQGHVFSHRHVLESVTCEVGHTPVPGGQQREGGGVKPGNINIHLKVQIVNDAYLSLTISSCPSLSPAFAVCSTINFIIYLRFTNLLC